MPSTLLSLTDAPDRFSQGAFAVDGEGAQLVLQTGPAAIGPPRQP